MPPNFLKRDSGSTRSEASQALPERPPESPEQLNNNTQTPVNGWNGNPLSLLPVVLHWLQGLSIINVVNIMLLSFSGGSLFAAYKILNDDWSVTKVLPAAISQDHLINGCIYKQYKVGGVLNNVVERRFDTDGIAIYSLTYQIPVENSKAKAEEMCGILKTIIKKSALKEFTTNSTGEEAENEKGSSLQTERQLKKEDLDNIIFSVKIDRHDTQEIMNNEQKTLSFFEWLAQVSSNKETIHPNLIINP